MKHTARTTIIESSTPGTCTRLFQLFVKIILPDSRVDTSSCNLCHCRCRSLGFLRESQTLQTVPAFWAPSRNRSDCLPASHPADANRGCDTHPAIPVRLFPGPSCAVGTNSAKAREQWTAPGSPVVSSCAAARITGPCTLKRGWSSPRIPATADPTAIPIRASRRKPVERWRSRIRSSITPAALNVA